ncbi:MAG TPA: MFS transporter [Microbacterium sp.]|uniref:MFS transporter n=1 Tax=Microbacterium sp. TaxID=51671 RepID=UPI002B460387|nr:MFS transporter [Microbacterium sp.]HKT55641.1 MFS transporter [Microbacterium sp.]
MTRAERLVLWIAILASFVAFLDGTVVNVALPAMQRELGGGLTTQQWIVDAYLVTLGALILVAGSLSDLFGRILILRIGLAGFGLASIAIAAAPDPLFLIVARGVQGIAGALLVPSSLALITSTFRGPAQARAIGIWTSATTAAMLVGPVLGGAFVDMLSWRFVFLINVLPIAVTLWLLAVLHRPDVRNEDATVDWAGAVLCTVGLGGTVFALIEQDRLGWADPVIWGSATLGVAALVGFLVRQATARSPLMPLDLFRVRNFWTGNVATAFIYGALGISGLVLTVYLQQGARWPATLAGLSALPATIIMILLSSRIGALSGRFGPRAFMTVGPLVMTLGMLLLLTVSDHLDYWLQVLPSIVVFGLGLSITVAPLTSAILGSIDPSRSGIASAVNNAVARIAGLLTVAMLGVIAGGAITLAGLHRTALVTAAMFAVGAVCSLIGIRNPPRAAAPESGSDGEQVRSDSSDATPS